MKIDPNDPRLTAYALGELDDAERAAIEALLNDDETARREIETIRRAANLVTSELQPEPCPRLNPEQLVAIQERLAVNETQTPASPWWKSLGWITALGAAAVAIAVLLLPAINGRRENPLQFALQSPMDHRATPWTAPQGVLAATTFVAEALFRNSPTLREIDKTVDIIVVATPISTKDTAEETNLPNISPAVQVVGLSSEFEVGFVLKGDNSLKKVVVHHYRLANNPGQHVWNDFRLASFDPRESTRYLLFLQREPDGRYAPFDQVDPAWTSILKLSGPKWDKMKIEDFKEWLDAKRWLSDQGENPVLGWTDMSPEISAAGRGEGSLHEAAFNGKLEKAKALIKANPDLVNSQTSYGSETPLQLAAEHGHILVAKFLLANKADVEAKSYGGWTALLNAVFGGHKDMVELLLTNKADVSVMDMDGRTPLHVAAENGYTDIAALLLANKADANVKNHEGDTPLHIAAAFGSKDMVELLLANKAEINAKDNSGRTPLDFAVLHANKDIAELLRQHGGLE